LSSLMSKRAVNGVEAVELAIVELTFDKSVYLIQLRAMVQVLFDHELLVLRVLYEMKYSFLAT